MPYTDGCLGLFTAGRCNGALVLHLPFTVVVWVDSPGLVYYRWLRLIGFWWTFVRSFLPRCCRWPFIRLRLIYTVTTVRYRHSPRAAFLTFVGRSGVELLLLPVLPTTLPFTVLHCGRCHAAVRCLPLPLPARCSRCRCGMIFALPFDTHMVPDLRLVAIPERYCTWLRFTWCCCSDLFRWLYLPCLF